MLAEERFAMILDLLAQKRSATVLELCDALDASESTIRHDLTQLDRQGLLKKVHGGATLVGRTVLADEPPMAAREEQSVEEKRLIARAAAAMITEKDFIFLDAGSTTLALAAALPAAAKADARTTKIALRRAAARTLPAASAARKKLGFPVPVRDWLRQEPYTSRVRAVFSRPAAAEFFDPRALHSMLNQHLHGGDCWRQIR